MNFIEDYFGKMGFTVCRFEPDEYLPFVDTFRIGNVAPSFTFFKWKSGDTDQQFFLDIKHKLKSILLKGLKFDNHVYDYERLRQFVDSYYPNLTPDEKLDSVLEYINSLTSFEGERIKIKMPDDDLANAYYFKESKEWQFYLETAVKLGLIGETDGHQYGQQGLWFNLTISGLTRQLSVKEKKESKFCFVAMSFDKEMDTVYQEAISVAIIICGFQPYIVNRINIDSDKTINDAILAGIKKARFTIAEFTNHKPGVYFEAGYALGRGQKVIYICRENEINKSHFDTRNYQHIVWSDLADLKEKLINKIEAFIKD